MSSTPELATPLDALFVGAVGPLPNDGAASAIDKQASADVHRLEVEGLAGDTVADHVHHGGAQRALNHYPAEHYRAWQARYPGHDHIFVPGVLGENLSTHGMTEADVQVGDIFTLGTATIQISQPRQPCWKIGVRTGIAGLAKAAVQTGCTGWLYRVLEAGDLRARDPLMRIEAAKHGISLARMWDIQNMRQPDEAARHDILTLAELPTLAPEWRKRMAWRLRRIAEQQSSA